MSAAPGGRQGEPNDGADRLFELPPELAIDAEIARRVIVDFVRNQLRQAGFSRGLPGCRVASDSALVAFLAAEAIGPETCCAC